MLHSSRPQAISWFQEYYKAGRLELRPPFQRKPVWTAKQRSFLVESILMDVPIPEVYVQVTQAEDGSEHYGVVDGQQRLRTILQFVGVESDEDQELGEDLNRFILDALPDRSPFHNAAFGAMSAEAKKQLFRYEICVRFLYTDDTHEVEDIFKRLNKYTLPLKAQELRNATFHGPFAKLSETLADDEYWAVNRILKPASIRRMGDIEMMSDLLIGLLHGPQGGSAKIIDEYYENYEAFEEEFPDETLITRLFQKALDTVKVVFPQIAEVPRWGNRADFYSLFVALSHLLRDKTLPAKNERALSRALSEFAIQVNESLEDPSANDEDDPSFIYARAIEKGSNDKARRTDRHEVLTTLMEQFFRKKDK
jgi:hypothetical protein